MRLKRLLYSSASAIFFQILTFIYGLVVPRLILSVYGSDVNGLINSIAQYLRFVAFLQLGMGAVVQTALYKPLSDGDNIRVSQIMTSSKKFFQKIGFIFVLYVIGLCFIYPYFFTEQFSYFYTLTLIIAISLSQIAEYMFGINYQLLLWADQKAYVNYFIQITTLIVNFGACVLLINLHADIQMVKSITAVIYICRPLLMYIYIKKHYNVNFNQKYENEPIKQKWNGVAQHIAALVVDSTDIVVLTLFTTLKSVSIYSVYSMIVLGLRQLITSATSGVRALLGDMYARKEASKLLETFSLYEWLLHNVVVGIFTCTGILIVPFVKIYTMGITDANYIQPIFSIFIVLSTGAYVLRDPYITMVNAAGHYKQTQTSAIIEALINIVVSIILVIKMGIVGVAIGTLCSMVYRTIYFVNYVDRFLIYREQKFFVKQIISDEVIVVLGLLMCTIWGKECSSYVEWILLAFKVGSTIILVSIVVNLFFYKERMSKVVKLAIKREQGL